MRAVFRMYPASSFDTDTDYCVQAFFECPAEYMYNSLGRTDRYYGNLSRLSWSSVFLSLYLMKPKN